MACSKSGNVRAHAEIPNRPRKAIDVQRPDALCFFSFVLFDSRENGPRRNGPEYREVDLRGARRLIEISSTALLFTQIEVERENKSDRKQKIVSDFPLYRNRKVIRIGRFFSRVYK